MDKEKTRFLTLNIIFVMKNDTNNYFCLVLAHNGSTEYGTLHLNSFTQTERVLMNLHWTKVWAIIWKKKTYECFDSSRIPVWCIPLFSK